MLTCSPLVPALGMKSASSIALLMFHLLTCCLLCRMEEVKTASQPTSDDPRGCVSSDGGGTVRRCGCFICGVDLRWRSRKKSEPRRRLFDEPVNIETKSATVLPPQETVHASGIVREPMVHRFSARPGTEVAQQKHQPATKTVATAYSRGDGLGPLPLQKHHDRRHRIVSHRLGRLEPETVSLSHYYRRHQHRARNHSRAMRQVAEWIENTGVVDNSAGVAGDEAVARRRKHRHRHVHEHRHYHYHYHYSAGGVV